MCISVLRKRILSELVFCLSKRNACLGTVVIFQGFATIALLLAHLFHINFCTALHTVLLKFYVHFRFSRILLTSLRSALFRPLISIKWRSAVITAISIQTLLGELSVLELSPSRLAQIGQIDHLHSNTPYLNLLMLMI